MFVQIAKGAVLLICSVLSMVPKPGNLAALVDLFEAEAVFDRAKSTDGCIDVMMLQQPEQVMVLGFWDDEAAYQRWIDDPHRSNGNDELNNLLAEPISTETVGGLFDIALSTTNLGVGSL